MTKKANKEIVEDMGKLNEKQVIITKRPNGTIRVQQSFATCVSATDVNGAEMTDLNYLIKKYTPNELATYLMQKNPQAPLVGYDFSKEPSLQDAKNEIVRLHNHFEDLKPELRKEFKNLTHFLKFIDNPQNKQRLLEMGLITETQLKKVEDITTPTKTTTQEEVTKKE